MTSRRSRTWSHGHLQNDGYEVYTCYDAHSALAYVAKMQLQLAILDVMLPDMSGFALCQQIRETHMFPIIMLTAKGEELDKITGLTLGADDYMTKPFSPLELVARVKAHCAAIPATIPPGSRMRPSATTLLGLPSAATAATAPSTTKSWR